MLDTKKNDQALLLRLPGELKSALQREATINGRRLTAEVNIRLRDSLKKNTTAPGLAPDATTRLSTAHGDELPHNGTGEGVPNYINFEELHPTDTAMLDIWRALPTEKKLALLSLLR